MTKYLNSGGFSVGVNGGDNYDRIFRKNKKAYKVEWFRDKYYIQVDGIIDWEKEFGSRESAENEVSRLSKLA